ncbi:B3/B4 domain-containing protein [Halalkalibacter urbisdiaboli]|uniref:B3/B4 domain-containing protein n=1 Tax=Halalkalibacter urbisdiaboli TaxID=1960589 RepID=UPI001FD9496D|nr:phenylalanine--tRNA ligase beta subunit-related protein [Halalkalibacter urbisdiaboli]
MVHIQIDPFISSVVPKLKLGLITYHDIVISDSPQMLKGRLQFFQETLKVELESKDLSEFKGIAEWREVFKAFHISPSKYRPSVESLYRRIKKGDSLPLVHSAVDLNTFFSLQYEIPFGIYDLDLIDGNISLRLGRQHEAYEGINGRENSLEGKLITSDLQGPFGSPIVDSLRTSVTPTTTNAVHILYLRPSMTKEEAEQLVKAVAKMFTQIHGGNASSDII